NTSDLYLSGAWTGATDAKPAYIADIKFQLSWYLTNAVRFVPGIDLKASSDGKSNGDSVTLGARFPVTARPRLIIEPAFVVESDVAYQDVNGIAPIVAHIVPKTLFPNANTSFYVQPLF